MYAIAATTRFVTGIASPVVKLLLARTKSGSASTVNGSWRFALVSCRTFSVKTRKRPKRLLTSKCKPIARIQLKLLVAVD